MRRLLFLLLLCVAAPVGAQQSEAERIVYSMLEEMAQDGTLTEDVQEQAATLVDIVENPIDINTATRADLQKLFFLSDYKIDNLLRHREIVDQIVTPQELMLVDGISEIEAQRLSKFIVINPVETASTSRSASANVVARWGRVFPDAKGFIPANDSTPAKYLGSPNKMLVRAQFNYGKEWQAGFVAESDAGEPMFSHGISTADFLSGHVSYTRNSGILRQAIVGHYMAQYGQGLGMWSGFAANMSSVQTSIGRRPSGLRPSMSASESGYLRGVAASLKVGGINIDVFGSHTDNDVSLITQNDTAEQQLAQSIQTDGYHRTESELKGRNNFQSMLGGAYLSKPFRHIVVGAGYNMWHASVPLGNSGDMYKYFFPKDEKRIHTLHADYRLYLQPLVAYAEVAWQSLDAFALTQGIDVPLGNGNDFTLAYRRFGKRYYAINQSPYSRSSQPSGESGVYAALALTPFDKVSVLANVDVYKNEWLKYQKPFPSDGYKCRVNVTYALRRNAQLTARIRHDDYEQSASGNKTLRERYRNTSYKAQWSFEPSYALSLRSAVEYVHCRSGNNRASNGALISQEVKYSAERIQVALMLVHFDTDDYNSRVYAYRPDVLYSMSVPSYSNNGVSATLNMKATLCDGVNLWLWGNYLKYYDRDTVGSGYNEIDRPHRFEAKVQLQVKLRYYKRTDFKKSL